MGTIETRWASRGMVTVLAVVTVAGWFSGLLVSPVDAEVPAPGNNVAAEAAPTPAAGGSLFPSNDLCLTCHSQSGITVKLSSGEEQAIDVVSPEAFGASTHGELACVACHGNQSVLPHPGLAIEGGQPSREVSSDVPICSSCHRDAYEAYLDSVHGTVTKLGDSRAPNCIDCHTAHSVQPVQEWSHEERALSCAQCHGGANATFASSAEGHQPPSRSWLPVSYFAGRFLVILTASVLAFGILHVELDVLRWLAGRVRGGKRRED